MSITNINYILLSMLQLETQTKVLHWQTDSYSQHVAYGNFHSAFSNLLDKFIETHMGKCFGSRFQLHQNKILLFSIDNLDVQNYLQTKIDELEKLIHILNNNTDTDLLNLKDEMIAKINQLKYHLSLN